MEPVRKPIYNLLKVTALLFFVDSIIVVLDQRIASLSILYAAMAITCLGCLYIERAYRLRGGTEAPGRFLRLAAVSLLVITVTSTVFIGGLGVSSIKWASEFPGVTTTLIIKNTT